MTSKKVKLDRWSPMSCLPIANLTPSGLLEMDMKDGEVELMRRDDMELRSNMTDPMVPIMATGVNKDGRNNSNNNNNNNSGSYAAASTTGKEWIDRDENLKVSLTTHRLVFFQENNANNAINNNNNNRNVRFLHLSNVHHIETTGGGSFTMSSPKIIVNSYIGDLLLVFRSSGATKDRDDLYKFLQKALSRKAWEIQLQLIAQKKASNEIAKRKVGVDAIMSKNTLRHKEAARLTDEAFQGDADALLREAAQLVKIIQKYVATLENKKERSGQEEKDAIHLSNMLENMGMASALSRENFRVRSGPSSSSKSGNDAAAFDDYTITLARQLADFLRPRLPAAGGLLTLTDVYCIYNRARGTNLISPEDLLDAVQCMNSLNLGMKERTFPSGVKVVQDDAFDDTKMAIKLKELAEEQFTVHATSGITSMEVSRNLHISALLAHEQLLQAEKMGYLCRDETLETTRFFPNLFDEYAKTCLSSRTAIN